MYRKNVAGQGFGFALVNKTTGSGLTGAAGSTTVKYSIEGGTQGSGTGTITERGNGQYWYAMPQAETNGIQTSFLFIGSSSFPVEKTVSFVSFDPTQTYLKSAIYEDNSDGGKTWYVSKTGNDTNDGRSIYASFLTIAKAFSVWLSGDTIRIGPGTFQEGSLLMSNMVGKIIGSDFQSTLIYPTSGTDYVLGCNNCATILKNISLKSDTHNYTLFQTGNVTTNSIILKDVLLSNTKDGGSAFYTFGSAACDRHEVIDSVLTANSGNAFVGEDGGGITFIRSSFKGREVGAYVTPLARLTAIDCHFEVSGSDAGAALSIYSGSGVKPNFIVHGCGILASAASGGEAIGLRVGSQNVNAQTELVNGTVIKVITPAGGTSYQIQGGPTARGQVLYSADCEIDDTKFDLTLVNDLTIALMTPFKAVKTKTDLLQFTATNFLQVDVQYWLSTPITVNVAGIPRVDIEYIDGGAIDGNNATLKLKALDIRNTTGQAIRVVSTIDHAVYFQTTSAFHSSFILDSTTGRTALHLIGGPNSPVVRLEAVSGNADGILIQPAGTGLIINPGVILDLTQLLDLTPTNDSVGDSLLAARAQGFGRWELDTVGNTIRLYAADGLTLVKTFDIDSPITPTYRHPV